MSKTRYFECEANGGHRWTYNDVAPDHAKCPSCDANGYEVAAPAVEEFKYEIILENKDPMLSTIEKTGKKIRFNMKDIEVFKSSCNTVIRETEGMISISHAKVKNIEDFHPYVLKLSSEELFTIHMYQTELAKVVLLEKKISDHKEAIAEYEAEEAKIKEQIGVALPKSALESNVIDLGGGQE